MLWLAEAENYRYDQYDSCLVRAKTKEEAIKIACAIFTERQGVISFTEIKSKGKSEIILSSFNAG